MHAIILAAGMGTRLGKYTKNNTKCMVPINGQTMIERTLDALDDVGIRACVIVVGYEKDNLCNFVGFQYKNIKITYVVNENYAKTNNIFSLCLACDFLLADDTLVLESDLIFETRIIKELLENPEPTMAVVAPYEFWMDGTVVQISQDNVITSFIPKINFNYCDKSTYYKTVNIYKFSRDFLRDCFVPFLQAYLKAKGNTCYYEEVLRVIVPIVQIKAMVLSDHKWYEIDDVQDKDIAEIIFSDTAPERFKRISTRYGGHWRFSKLLDFCYLVNPYFPPEQMRNEMRAYFDVLLSEYPSGLDVQNLLAAKLFNVERENVLVGNGATELIKAVSHAFQTCGRYDGGCGKIGIIHPTFNEYPECFGDAEIIRFGTESINYGIEELIGWSADCDMLVLINPDNPSGNYISRNDITRLLEHMKINNKKLLLDESFVDFCDVEDGSLIHQDVLDEYRNLIVIKSLSKSYGVPGLRLGVLSCGDRAFIRNIREQIPIWNINSFAEYFLQIIGKYARDYRLACRRVAEERGRFYGLLEKTGLFKIIYPSQANYFLCKLKDDILAEDLSYYLLERHEILIKNLYGKKGLSAGSWIRLAVRDRQDDDFLIDKLADYKLSG